MSPYHLFPKFTSLVLVRCSLQICFASCDFNCLFRCHLRQIYHSHNPLQRGLRSRGALFKKPSPHSARYACQHYHFRSHYYYPASFNNSNYIINSMNLIIGAIFCYSKLLYLYHYYYKSQIYKLIELIEVMTYWFLSTSIDFLI